VRRGHHSSADTTPLAPRTRRGGHGSSRDRAAPPASPLRHPRGQGRVPGCSRGGGGGVGDVRPGPHAVASAPRRPWLAPWAWPPSANPPPAPEAWNSPRYARAPRLRRSWPRTPGKGYCQGVGVRGLCPRAGEPASEFKGGGGGFQSSRLGRRCGCVVGDLAALHSGLIVFHASWGRQTTRSCQTGYWSTILHRISVPCHAALSSTDAPTNETCRCYTCCSILKIHTGACISRTANGSCLIVSGPATRVLQQRPLATGATGLRPQGEVCVVTKLYRAFYVRSRFSGF
jgi:hypothetical protein